MKLVNGLKPCPFCGEATDAVSILETDSGIDGISGEYYVFCLTCFAQSGEFPSRREAKRSWNRRVPPK